MNGYCSNSPLRCTHARSMTLISLSNNGCPECGLALVPANSFNKSLQTEQQFLQLSLFVIALLLLSLAYIYYANFV